MEPYRPGSAPGTPTSHNAATVFPNPSSIYGSTKLAQEHVLGSWCDAYGVPLSVLRFQNVYGRGQSPTNPYTGIINIFHRIAARGEAINAYEDGRIGRDFVYIDVVVDACIAALFRSGAAPLVCDVGFGQVTTILKAAQVIARIHGAPEPVISGQFRDGDIRWSVADIEAMKNVLRVNPRVGFEDGVRIVGSWLDETGHLFPVSLRN